MAAFRCAEELKDVTIWREHELRLRDLFLFQNKSLAQVKHAMEKDHGWPEFKEITYEVVMRDILGFRKNLKSDDWPDIKYHMDKRSREGKRSEVLLNGRVMNSATVSRGIKRKPRRHVVRVGSPVLRRELCIRTPPPTASRNPVVLPIPGHELRAASPLDVSHVVITPTSFREPQNLRIAQSPANVLSLLSPEIRDILSCSPFNQFATMIQEIGLFHSSGLKNSRTPRAASTILSTTTPGDSFHGLGTSTTNFLASAPIQGTFQSLVTQSTDLTSFNDYFGDLMRACYMLANNHFELDDRRKFLDWVGLVADPKLLRQLFSLETPAVVGLWENSIRAAGDMKNSKAFKMLFEACPVTNTSHFSHSHLPLCLGAAISLVSDEGDNVARYLLEQALVSPYTRLPCNYFLRDPFLFAISSGNRNVVAMLIKHGAVAGADDSYDHKLGDRLLRELYRIPNTTFVPIATMLIDAGLKIDFIPVTHCFSTRHADTLGWEAPGFPKLLVDQLYFDNDPNSRELYNVLTPHSKWARDCVTVSGILLAAEQGTTCVQQYLLSKEKPQASVKGVLLEIALSEAAEGGMADALECLLQLNVDPNASQLEQLKLAPRFISQQSPVTWNPISRAVNSLKPRTVTELLEHGVGLDHSMILNSFMEACQRPGPTWSARYQICELLLNHGVPIGSFRLSHVYWVALSPGQIPFHRLPTPEEIAKHRDFEPDCQLCDMLKCHGFSFHHEENGVNMLQMAIRSNCNLKTAEYLVRSGVGVHSAPQSGGHYELWCGRTTMLHDALLSSRTGLSGIVGLLLQQGADPYATTSEGITVLEASVLVNGEVGVVLRNHPDLQPETYLKLFWMLFRATSNQHKSLSPPFKLVSPISALIKLRESDANILVLLDTGIDINFCGSWEHARPPLVTAINNGRVSLAMQLIERGADLDLRRKPESHDTALQAACSLRDKSMFDVVQHLIHKGADVNAPPPNAGYTALQGAASMGNLATASLLLQNGANVNSDAGSGFWIPGTKLAYRAVDIAAGYGHLDMVQLLVQSGGASGAPGATGLDDTIRIAIKRGYYGIAEYIRQHLETKYASENGQHPSFEQSAMLRAFHSIREESIDEESSDEESSEEDSDEGGSDEGGSEEESEEESDDGEGSDMETMVPVQLVSHSMQQGLETEMVWINDDPPDSGPNMEVVIADDAGDPGAVEFANNAEYLGPMWGVGGAGDIWDMGDMNIEDVMGIRDMLGMDETGGFGMYGL